MSKPTGSEDKEILFIETLLALTQDVIDYANKVKEISDDPEVLYLNLKMESAGLVAHKVVADYHPRLTRLKKLALQQGDIRVRTKKSPPDKGGPKQKGKTDAKQTQKLYHKP